MTKYKVKDSKAFDNYLDTTLHRVPIFALAEHRCSKTGNKIRSTSCLVYRKYDKAGRRGSVTIRKDKLKTKSILRNYDLSKITFLILN